MHTAAISKDMTVREIITLVPAAADIMIEYGLHCFSCSVGGMETLEEGCAMHGFDADTVAALVEDICDAMNRSPSRPQSITVTRDAALAIQGIAESQGRKKEVLTVTVDEHGGFCLEFQDKPLQGDLAFFSPEVPAMKIYASVLTLSRIGGATVDMRDGRLKLDLPEDCCHEDQSCACRRG